MKSLLTSFKNRWHAEAGYGPVLSMAIPLIISTGSWSVQHFIDRTFLTWYGAEAIAASLPAGILHFAAMCFFLGTVTYVTTFVAQYYGAERFHRIGPAIWQGVYMSLIGSILFLALIPCAPSIFSFVGHGGLTEQYEIIYFKILCLGVFPALAGAAFSGLFTGLGKTWTVMWINVIATIVNIVLDYLLIFGKGGFPRLGIKGAGIATVIAMFVSCGIAFILIAQKKYSTKFHTLSGWKYDNLLFLRLLRFGTPSGIQFFFDVFGFAAFILMIGRLGTASLAATNIAFNINMLAFMPMLGLGIAISVLVGQNITKNRIDLAEKSVYSGFHMTIVYMTCIAVCYVVIPRVFLLPFKAQADPQEFARIYTTTIVLLRFIAVYCVFDSMLIIFSSAIKGAGDTRFVMITNSIISLVVLVIPSYYALIVLKTSLYVGWYFATIYVVILAFVFLIRFRNGKWKTMRVIEAAQPMNN